MLQNFTKLGLVANINQSLAYVMVVCTPYYKSLLQLGVSLMQFNNPYWSNKLKIGCLQRWLIVHSILYYELNNSIVNDKMFDANAYQLVGLQKQYPEDAKQSEYWYVFNDFDGSTGFDLYHRLNKKDKAYLKQIAQHLIRLNRGGVYGRKR